MMASTDLLATESGPRPVSQRSMVELVIDEVRRSILDGSLPPGSPVSINDLSSRLNVSHIPVREALRRLEGEGLVELRRSRSAVVAPLSLEDLRDVFGLRALLEGEVMSRAAKIYTDADLERLEQAWELLRVQRDDDAESLSARHAAFHRLLVAPAASQWDLRLLDIVWQAHARYMYLIFTGSRDLGETDLRDAHLDLLQAARLRSPRAARRAVKEHLARGVALVGPALARAPRAVTGAESD
jgi:DNA-binding GntR family transcriptional regulator